MLAVILFTLIGFVYSTYTTVAFDGTKSLFQVLPSYVSVLFEPAMLTNSQEIGGSYCTRMMKNLVDAAPVQFKFGGEGSDLVVFEEHGKSGMCEKGICINSDFWMELMTFVHDAGVDMVFQLSGSDRTSIGLWNYTNANELIKFVASKQSSQIFALGDCKTTKLMTADQMSQTLNVMEAITNIHSFHSIQGPELCVDDQSYYRHVLNGTQSEKFTGHAINAEFGTTDLASNVMNLTSFSSMMSAVSVMVGIKNSMGITMPVLLDGILSNLGSAAADSNSFISGFLTLYTLGNAGQARVSEVMLPYFFTNHKENPNYYLALVWKQLIGLKVLDSSYFGDKDGLDFTVWCGVSSSPVLVFINMNSVPGTVAIQYGVTSPRVEYFFTSSSDSKNSNLQSTQSYLNGKLLQPDQSGYIVNPINGNTISGSNPLVLPPYSYGFVVLEGMKAPACSK